MGQLSILLMAEVLLFFLCITISKKDMLSPQVGFIACFLPGTVYAYFWVERWELKLSSQTIWAILLGQVIFTIISAVMLFCYKHFVIKGHTRKRSSGKYILEMDREIKRWKLMILIAIQCAAIVGTILFFVRQYGNNLLLAFGQYRDAQRLGMIVIPAHIRMLRRIAIATGYIQSYLFFHDIICKTNRNRYIYLFGIFLSFINGFLSGARGEVMFYVMGMVMQYFMIHRISNTKIRMRTVLKCTLLGVAVITMFPRMGDLVGKHLDFSLDEYVAIYLSAELKNLDIFIQKGMFGTDILNSQTMNFLVKSIAILLRKPKWIHKLDNPFNFVNGYQLGNVSTVFYAFLYDGGYWGIVFFTGIMAVISQFTYNKAKRENITNSIGFYTILYSYMWSTIVLSFFSDKFFETFFTTSIIWTLLCWIFLSWFLQKKIKVF